MPKSYFVFAAALDCAEREAVYIGQDEYPKLGAIEHRSEFVSGYIDLALEIINNEVVARHHLSEMSWYMRSCFTESLNRLELSIAGWSH